MNSLGLRFEPLTPRCWGAFRDLFRDRGAFGGCWCMWWRETRREFSQRAGPGNEQAMQDIVQSGRVPGLLAWAGQRAVGWVSLGPREDFPPLNRSRTLKPVDTEPVWAIVCFYIDEAFRGQGVMAGLIGAACEYARDRGARAIEAFPEEPAQGARSVPAAFSGYMGTTPAFRRAGFEELVRRGRQPVMRKRLD